MAIGLFIVMAAGVNLRRGAQFLAARQRKSESQNRKSAASQSKAQAHAQAISADDKWLSREAFGLRRRSLTSPDDCVSKERKARPLAAT